MRLLNTSTHQLESFLGTEKPPYAILSHTWEPEGEILFEDLQNKSEHALRLKSGFPKVKHACKRALLDGYKYVWIDTCCIDKSSSAELSEAINSMFRWYQQSQICYAFLSDVEDRKHVQASEFSLKTSRWFTRGWTLQELIAPKAVDFYDTNWKIIGSRSSLASEISRMTGIEEQILIRDPLDCRTVNSMLHSTSVAQRMRWASKRVTTREEDLAYCLMGLFDVNMPLLYGESKKAFFRLQEAIVNGSDDQSILAFRSAGVLAREDFVRGGFTSVLAPDVSYFRDDIRYDWHATREAKTLRLDAGRLTLEVYLVRLAPSYGNWWAQDQLAPTHAALLDCFCGNDYLSRPVLLLRSTDGTVFTRCFPRAILWKANVSSVAKLDVMCGPLEGENALSVRPLISLDDHGQKRLIILQSHREYVVDALSHAPVTLDYHDVLEHCSVGYVYPMLNNKESRVTLFDSIGIVALRFRTEHILVVWARDMPREPWCNIYSLESLTRLRSFSEYRSMETDNAMEHIILRVKEHERSKLALRALFADEPCEEAPDRSSVVAGEMLICHYYKHVDFIGRRLYIIKLLAKPITGQNTQTSKKPWLQRLHIREK